RSVAGPQGASRLGSVVNFDAAQAIEEMRSLCQGRVPHEPDFLFFRHLTKVRPLLVDVGANAGQSAISFRIACPWGRVFSFEPNRIYSPVLEYLGREVFSAGDFAFMLSGCGREDGELALILPIVDGKPYLEEASVDRAQFDKPWAVDRLRSYGRHLTFEEMSV